MKDLALLAPAVVAVSPWASALQAPTQPAAPSAEVITLGKSVAPFEQGWKFHPGDSPLGQWRTALGPAGLRRFAGRAGLRPAGRHHRRARRLHRTVAGGQTAAARRGRRSVTSVPAGAPPLPKGQDGSNSCTPHPVPRPWALLVEVVAIGKSNGINVTKLSTVMGAPPLVNDG
jgi:hypothetical protein